MNTCQQYFCACALALLTQAAFAQSAPNDEWGGTPGNPGRKGGNGK